MQWNDRYSVDIPVIDEQHKELFIRINGLVEDIKAARCRLTIDDTTKFLEDYVVTHFRDEEGYMEQAGYPAVETHRAQHRKFMQEFSRLKAELENEHSDYNRSVLTNQIVVDWIAEHVTTVDRAFGAYLREKGISLRT